MDAADTEVRNRRNCSPFPPEELAKFRALLIQQQANVLRSCQDLSHVALRKAGDASGDVSDDSADLAAETCEQDLSLHFLGRAQLELREITQSLERIDQRSYGLCDDCGQAIPAARLEALPTACYCIPCKAKSEGP